MTAAPRRAENNILPSKKLPAAQFRIDSQLLYRKGGTHDSKWGSVSKLLHERALSSFDIL